MSSTASPTEAAFLEARDARQRELQRALDRGGAASYLMAGTNVPGPDKHRPGLDPLFRGALEALKAELGLEVLHAGSDLLGPLCLGSSRAAPSTAKLVAVAIEARGPSGRILDLDVYRPDGSQVDRASLGLPPRPCLLCGEPARECILLRRHAEGELLARTDALLRALEATSRP